ncbi:MAG: DUF4411 family protein [Bacteroidetes bacterium]|nr:DUF4411 family protein [Bacteroidota bacterium]
MDTNVFIDAYKFHYGFEFHPGYWDWLIHANQSGIVFSIDAVYDELSQKEDALFIWFKEHRDTLIIEPPKDLNLHVNHVSDLLSGQNYKPHAIAEFMMSADFRIIAHAMSYQSKVVTHEVIRSRKGRIKIPAICKELDVECINPFEMLRTESPRFILDLGS